MRTKTAKENKALEKYLPYLEGVECHTPICLVSIRKGPYCNVFIAETLTINPSYSMTLRKNETVDINLAGEVYSFQ